MLEEWERYAPQFIKVTPVEYKHHLEKDICGKSKEK